MPLVGGGKQAVDETDLEKGVHPLVVRRKVRPITTCSDRGSTCQKASKGY